MPVNGCDIEIRKIFSLHKLSQKIQYELEDTHAIMSMVQDGLGVSILPEMILSQLPYDLCIPPLFEEHFRLIDIATVSFKNVSPVAKTFLDFITARIDQL